MSTKTVAAVCQERYRLKLFFEVLKQSPRIEAFVDARANAGLVQICRQ
ncbi:MAG: hypothetical protein ABFD86_23815 [Bryobacteraceae bacterium]